MKTSAIQGTKPRHRLKCQAPNRRRGSGAGVRELGKQTDSAPLGRPQDLIRKSNGFDIAWVRREGNYHGKHSYALLSRCRALPGLDPITLLLAAGGIYTARMLSAGFNAIGVQRRNADLGGPSDLDHVPAARPIPTFGRPGSVGAKSNTGGLGPNGDCCGTSRSSPGSSRRPASGGAPSSGGHAP